MIEIQELANTISEIKRNHNSLSILLNIEEVFDRINLYAYENWIKGEIIRGPILNKYWVEVYLMYHQKFKPNPNGALRLKKHGCQVFIKEDTIETAVKIKKPEDINPEFEKSGKRKPKTKNIPVYIVRMVLPRVMLDNYNLKRFQNFLDDVEIDEITNAFDSGHDVERLTRQDDEEKEGGAQDEVRESFLREGMRHGELKGLIKNQFEADRYKPKIGNEEETVVIAFTVTYKEPADDLARFIETSELEHLDVDVSASPDPNGTYKVFVEFQRDIKLFGKVDSLLKGINQIIGHDKTWSYIAWRKKGELTEFNEENFTTDIVQSSVEYRQEFLMDTPGI